MRFILASASPRRRELLGGLGIDFEVCPSDTPEKIDPSASFSEVCKNLARIKAEDIFNKQGDEDIAVLGADTIVVLNNMILGKPKDKEEAFKMLSSLSGRSHFVYTGSCLIVKKDGEVKKTVLSDKTEVFMAPMTEDEIRSYIETGEPMDKAGAYGIQGIGARFIERINGNYQTVVGLNTCSLCKTLKETGIL